MTCNSLHSFLIRSYFSSCAQLRKICSRHICTFLFLCFSLSWICPKSSTFDSVEPLSTFLSQIRVEVGTRLTVQGKAHTIQLSVCSHLSSKRATLWNQLRRFIFRQIRGHIRTEFRVSIRHRWDRLLRQQSSITIYRLPTKKTNLLF